MKFEQTYLPNLIKVVQRDGLFTLEFIDYDNNEIVFAMSWEQMRQLKRDLEEIKGL